MNYHNTYNSDVHSTWNKDDPSFQLTSTIPWIEDQDLLSPSNFLECESKRFGKDNSEESELGPLSTNRDPEQALFFIESCLNDRKGDDFSEMVQLFQSTVYQSDPLGENGDNTDFSLFIKENDELLPPELEPKISFNFDFTGDRAFLLEDIFNVECPQELQDNRLQKENSYLTKRSLDHDVNIMNEFIEGPQIEGFRKLRMAQKETGPYYNSQAVDLEVYKFYLEEMSKELYGKCRSNTDKTDDPSESDSKFRVSMSQNYKGNLASGFGKLLCDPGTMIDSGLYQKLVELIEEYKTRYPEIRKQSLEDFFNKIIEYTAKKIYGKVDRGTRKGLRSHPYKINSMEDYEEAFYPNDKDKATTAIIKNILRELFEYFLNSKFYYTFVLKYCEAEQQGKLFLLLKVDEITKVFSSPQGKKKYRPKFRCPPNSLLFRQDFPVDFFIEIMNVLLYIASIACSMYVRSKKS